MPSERSRSVRRISHRFQNEKQSERPCCAQVNRCQNRNPTHRRRPEKKRASECQNRWKCERPGTRGGRSGPTSEGGRPICEGRWILGAERTFPAREDELSLLTLGPLHAFRPKAESPEPARAGKVVQHMAPSVPTGSQRRLPTPPTHLLLLAALPVEHAGAKKTNTEAAQRNVISLASEPMLKLCLGIPACFTLAVRSLRLSSAYHAVRNKERSLLDPCTLLDGIINLVQQMECFPMSFGFIGGVFTLGVVKKSEMRQIRRLSNRLPHFFPPNTSSGFFLVCLSLPHNFCA